MSLILLILVIGSMVGIGAMILYTVYHRFIKSDIGHHIKQTPESQTENTDGIEYNVPDSRVNAFIQTVTDIIPAHLPDKLLMSLHNGWTMFNGTACVICQHNPKTDVLEKWEIQNHSITEDPKAYQCRTPQELYAMMLWLDEVEDVYKKQADNLSKINQALMVIVLVSIGLLSVIMLGD